MAMPWSSFAFRVPAKLIIGQLSTGATIQPKAATSGLKQRNCTVCKGKCQNVLAQHRSSIRYI